jgi:DNA-binding HxlR family transcriptional regulator
MRFNTILRHIKKINIKHLNKDLSETRNWNWISKYQEEEKAFYLLVNQKFAYKKM